MAVLKDLIVHGRSRFVNGIDADSIHANLIDANDGIFKTITTTTLDAETITTDMLTAQNARVAQTLTVDGTISTNKWEAANIANIGGNFYISPTGKADSGNITVTKTGSITINGVSVGVYTLVVGSASFGVTSTSSTIWGTNSKVIFTGSIAYNSSKKYPLGTCNGTMTSVSTGSGTLTGFTITGVNSPALDVFFKEQGVTSVSSTACTGYEMQISVYQSYYSSALHPIGILLTSYGKDKKQYIDIYGGANTLGDSASGFANPSVRIGQLDGLPNIVDGSTDSTTAPSGWGIYTDNGFFKGKIVSNAGKIGNFTINSALYSNNHSSWNTNSSGIYINNDGIAGGPGGKWWFWQDGSAQIGAMTLSAAGVLTVPAANVSGELTAATISGSKITANTITAGQIASNTITAAEIASNAITADKIQAGAVTADKLDATTINASKKLTVGAMTDAAANSILNSNLEIGGRNLIPLSFNLKSFTVENASYATGTWTDTAVTVLNVQSGTYGIFYDFSIESNTTYTLSFNVESIVGTARTSGGFKKSDNTIIGSQIWNHSALDYAQVVAGRNIRTFTTPNESAIMRLYISVTNKDSQQVISKIKLEKGNKATDWSPAPEDLDVHKYVTEIDSNGIWVTPSDKKPTDTSTGAGATGTKIDGTGVGIYVGGTKLAQYGTTTYFYEPDGTTAATLDGTGLNIKTGTITLGTNFSVTSAGVLTAKSGTIGGFAIDSTSIHTNGVAVTSNEDNSIALSSSDFTRTINSTSRAGLRLAIGDKFGITGDGILYASGATIQGDVTVSKLTVSSGATISDTDGLINNDIVREEASQEIQDTYTSLSDNLDELQANLATTIDDLQELNTYSETEIERITQNVNEYLGANGYMLIEDQGLKITKGNFAVIITGTDILFQEDGTTVAWISGQKLYINRTEVTQSMKVGNFEWVIRTDGRLTLAYTGGN